MKKASTKPVGMALLLATGRDNNKVPIRIIPAKPTTSTCAGVIWRKGVPLLLRAVRIFSSRKSFPRHLVRSPHILKKGTVLNQQNYRTADRLCLGLRKRKGGHLWRKSHPPFAQHKVCDSIADMDHFVTKPFNFLKVRSLAVAAAPTGMICKRKL